MDGVQHRRVVRLPGRDDAAPDRQRRYFAFAQRLHKTRGGRVGERPLFARGRRVQKRAVFGHDLVEKIKPRHDALQVVQLPTGDEHQAAP